MSSANKIKRLKRIYIGLRLFWFYLLVTLLILCGRNNWTWAWIYLAVLWIISFIIIKMDKKYKIHKKLTGKE